MEIKWDVVKIKEISLCDRTYIECYVTQRNTHSIEKPLGLFYLMSPLLLWDFPRQFHLPQGDPWAAHHPAFIMNSRYSEPSWGESFWAGLLKRHGKLKQVLNLRNRHDGEKINKKRKIKTEGGKGQTGWECKSIKLILFLTF